MTRAERRKHWDGKHVHAATILASRPVAVRVSEAWTLSSCKRICWTESIFKTVKGEVAVAIYVEVVGQMLPEVGMLAVFLTQVEGRSFLIRWHKSSVRRQNKA